MLWNSQENKIIERHAIVRGHVQGIGFRVTVHHYALQLNIVGTVRNLSDGSVEIYAQGSQDNLDRLFKTIQQEIGSRFIDSLSTEEVIPLRHYDAFRIVH
jgi:acylphosphatase